MRNISNINKSAFSGVMLLLIMIFLSSVSASDNKNPFNIAIFPFNDVQSKSFDFKITSMLGNELLKYEFIRVLPVETVREKIYEIEPDVLWTEKQDLEKRGGILWTIEPFIREEIIETMSADYYVYGDFNKINEFVALSMLPTTSYY